LDSTEFQTWLETGTQTLFCPGIPGAGKTIIAAIVVDHLLTLFKDDLATGIAYLYCNFGQQHEQQAEDLLASLLKQLGMRQSPLPGSVKDLYDHHKATRTRPSVDEILRILQSVVTTYSRIFIIVDALDECQASNGCRTRFLSELFALRARHGANILATSRLIPDIVDQFKSSVRLEIRADRADVERYLEGHMGQLPSIVHQNTQLREEIKTGISGAVDGMCVSR
jgi:Cdc6-like AAA superfamily ATPase